MGKVSYDVIADVMINVHLLHLQMLRLILW